MSFTDIDFLFFFLPLCWATHTVSGRARNLVLAAASLLFYALGAGVFTMVIAASIAFNYTLALAVARRRADSTHHLVLGVGITINVAALAWFKYAGFAVDNINQLLGLLHVSSWPVPQVSLPIGISFFTFHAISYLIDVSRGHATAQKRPTEAALYLLLFPQLVAGPIVRYREIADQLAARHLTAAHTAEGLRRFVVGLAKKLLIANTVAVPADAIFAMPAHQVGPALAWLAVICYTLQIYFDFSGYSDMAVGLGRLFGFSLPENFRHPYVATSVQDFWRRWHMTLSSWFRDYLYVPLGGNRRGTVLEYRNLLIVFFLCGLWHGASWTFVIWGLFHGTFLILERAVPAWMPTGVLPRIGRHVYVLAVIMVGWVFFRADSMGQAWSFLGAMMGRTPAEAPTLLVSSFLTLDVMVALVLGMLGATPLSSIAWQHAIRAGGSLRAPWPVYAEWTLLAARTTATLVLLGLSLVFAAAGTYNPFIYFRF